MEYEFMSKEELENSKEDKELEFQNIIDGLQRARESLNCISDYESCEESISYLEEVLKDLEYQADRLKAELDEIVEWLSIEPYDEYNERMNEYRRMQGF